MLNRRLIRIKVLQEIYAYHQAENKSLRETKTFILKSVKGIEKTFIDLVQFSFELFDYVNQKFINADKYLKSNKSHHSLKNLILSDNLFLNHIKTNPKIVEILNKVSHNWTREDDFMFSIYKKITEEDWFKIVEEKYNKDFETDKNLIMELYRFIILKSEDFNSKMEEITIHWQDEKIALLNTLEKIVKSASQSNSQLEIPLISKNLDEDLEFAEKLAEIALKNQSKFEEMIAEQTPDWDTERIARMDLYIMSMALSEFTEFENIPVKVTLNEYLELAKIYSTPQSSKFVNGVLDKLLNILKERGEISKKGRGLIEN